MRKLLLVLLTLGMSQAALAYQMPTGNFDPMATLAAQDASRAADCPYKKANKYQESLLGSNYGLKVKNFNFEIAGEQFKGIPNQ